MAQPANIPKLLPKFKFLSVFHDELSLPETDRQTDRQTVIDRDRQTDRQR